ncbi:MAG TPA: hypothetical protein VF174_15985 [Micromonosporaceae bacterium]
MSAATRRRAAAILLPLTITGAVAATPAGATLVKAPAGVSVAVSSEGRNPVYRIEVRNETDIEIATTVRQGLPRDAAIESVSDGGKAEPAEPNRTEVAWQLRLPPRSSKSLHTALSAAPHVPLAAPACAYTSDDTRAYDCATAVWGQDRGTPWWQRPAVLVGSLVTLLAVVGAVTVGRRRFGGRTSRPFARTAHRLAAIRSVPRRLVARPDGRPPATWKVVGTAALLFVTTTAGLVLAAGGAVTSLSPNTQSTTGAWVGAAATGRMGTPMRDSAFEFTVYRLACAPDEQGGRRRCVADIGLRNVSDKSQPWYAGMQRLYLAGGEWVVADDAATRAANGNQDIFAHPIPAGGRLLAPLVFNVPAEADPARIELRSAVFSAGVAVVP